MRACLEIGPLPSIKGTQPRVATLLEPRTPKSPPRKAAATKTETLIGGSDAQRFHFAVEVRAFEADGGGGLGHVPAIFLEFAEDEFAFVGAASFVQGAVRLLGAFYHAAEKFGREMMRLDADLWADDDQTFD